MATRSLTRVHNMWERVEDTLPSRWNELVSLLSSFVKPGKGIIQPHQLLEEFERVVEEEERKKLNEDPFGEVFRSPQEVIELPPWVALAVRPRPGVWEDERVNVHELVEQPSAHQYSKFKETLVDGRGTLDDKTKPIISTMARHTPGGVSEAVITLHHGLSSPIKTLAFSRLNHHSAHESLLPITVRDNKDSSSPRRKGGEYESWAKLNLMLSSAGILALLSMSSSLVNDQFPSCAAYAVGVFVAFLLSQVVYCMSSYLCKNMNVMLLSVSSVTITAAFSLILLLKSHPNAIPSVSHGL